MGKAGYLFLSCGWISMDVLSERFLSGSGALSRYHSRTARCGLRNPSDTTRVALGELSGYEG